MEDSCQLFLRHTNRRRRLLPQFSLCTMDKGRVCWWCYAACLIIEILTLPSLCQTLIHHCNYALVSMQAGARSGLGERAARKHEPSIDRCEVLRRDASEDGICGLMSDASIFCYNLRTLMSEENSIRRAAVKCIMVKTLFINVCLRGNSTELIFFFFFFSRLLFSTFPESTPSFSFLCLCSRVMVHRLTGGERKVIISALSNEARISIPI